MKDVKIVIGANYGDEGKGLMTRHFVLDAKSKGETPIVIFHNGTAQRGHTVDYDETHRHVYHHFGSGTGDGAATFFAETFFIHPMEFHREYNELKSKGITPQLIYYDPKAKVITPYDMMVDHATEEWIAKLKGEREFGSCGFGSWCAIEDRYPLRTSDFSVSEWKKALISGREEICFFMEAVWNDCLSILVKRGVDIEKTSFAHLLKNRSAVIDNFINDLYFFFGRSAEVSFSYLFNKSLFDNFIFENGQGLGLDKDVNNNWHTTSKTGIYNPYHMLKDEKDFDAEVCYVTRSYLTRHGVGPLENQANKTDLGAIGIDKTNVFNEFQGALKYGAIDNNALRNRVRDDYDLVGSDNRFNKSICITHTNEFNCKVNEKYYSDNPFEVKENK